MLAQHQGARGAAAIGTCARSTCPARRSATTTFSTSCAQQFVAVHGIPHSQVCFEITETTAVASLTKATEFMTALRGARLPLRARRFRRRRVVVHVPEAPARRLPEDRRQLRQGHAATIRSITRWSRRSTASATSWARRRSPNRSRATTIAEGAARDRRRLRAGLRDRRRRRRSADCTHCPKWQRARPRAVFELLSRSRARSAARLTNGTFAGLRCLSRMPEVRKGQAPPPIDRDAFHDKFQQSFVDPAFAVEKDAIARLETIAWHAYQDGRKAPLAHAAGPGFVDPDYKLSDEWRATRDRVQAAQARQRDATTPSRVLVVIGSARNDGTCPGEISKTFRLATWARRDLRAGRRSTPTCSTSAC